MQSPTTTLSFGALLKQLRKQAGMTQRDLATALNYSDSLISSLEKAQRKPDLNFVIEQLIPALGLQAEPKTAAWLIERAAAARGEQPPTAVTLQRTTHLVLQEELGDQTTPLPAPPTALLGRSAEVSGLCQRLLGHGGRLLTLVGPPGIGKTRLALAVAAQVQHHYAAGALFVPLATITDPALVVPALLSALNVPDGSAKLPQTRLIEHLRRKELLLVLDNFEQLMAAGAFVAELLAACSGLHILVTSRERLHLRAEQRYKVQPLPLPAAVDLFVQRATAVDVDFELTPAQRPTLEAICQRLDRLPLAIELCAAQIDLLPPTQLLARLQAHPLDLLVAGAQDLPPQQRTLRQAIQQSYTLLTEEERTLFRTLGVFLGGCDLAAIAAVHPGGQAGLTPSLLATLHALIGKSLVQTETLAAGEQRFLLLETIREFALEQVRRQGEETHLRQRHYATYLQLARTADRHVRTPAVTTWLVRLKPEQDNFRVAWQWAFEEKHYADAAWLLFPLSYYWFLMGQRYVTAIALSQLLPHRHTFPPDLRLALLIVTTATVRPEEAASVADYATEMLQLVELCTNKLLQAAAWALIANNTKVISPVLALERSIALARAGDEAPRAASEFGAATDRNFLLATHLLTYATFVLERGELDQATALATESFALSRVQGDKALMGGSLAILGRVAFLYGDLAQAHTYFQEAMTMADATMRCEWQPVFALVCLYQGNVRAAQHLLSESIRFCLEQQEKFFLARNYTYLIETALATEVFAEAEHWLAQSLAAHADPCRITVDEVERLWLAARLFTGQQQYLRAATLFGVADQMHNQLPAMMVRPMQVLANTALATVRAGLDPAVFVEAFTTGQQMSLKVAYATLLSASHDAGVAMMG